MKVSTENMGNCQVLLNVEVEVDELNASLNEAYRYLVSKVSVPGFRKGKAPRNVVEQHVGKDALLEEALERLIPRLYKEAVESQELDPIDQPKIEIVQTEPVMFKAVVPVKPVVELGDYRSIRLESIPVEVSDEDIEAAIEQLRQKQGVWMPVDRPLQFGDLVTMDIEAHVENKTFLNHKDIVYEVREKSDLPLPGFAMSLEGIKKGEEGIFSLNISAGYKVKEFAGKECSFRVNVSEIKEKELPQLDDEFAQSIDYDNLISMREKVAADLKAKAEAKSRSELGQKMLHTIAEIGQVNYPPILEDREIDNLLENEARHFGYSEVEDYLRRANKSREELKEGLRPVARQRLIHSLILEKLAEEEKIEISAAEVDEKVREIIGDTEDKEKMQQFFALPQVRESIEQSLRTQKTIDLLLQMATNSTEEKTQEE